VTIIKPIFVVKIGSILGEKIGHKNQVNSSSKKIGSILGKNWVNFFLHKNQANSCSENWFNSWRDNWADACTKIKPIHAVINFAQKIKPIVQ